MPHRTSLTAPATASPTAGSTIEIGLDRPGLRTNDFISVRGPRQRGLPPLSSNTIRTDRGNPRGWKCPRPGPYVIEYIEAQDRTPLAAVTIEISAVSRASLTAPATAPAGSTIEVGWTRPGLRQ